MRLPFGKYRGCLLEDLPRDYLFWLHARDLREPLRTHVDIEYDRRYRQESERGASFAIVDARILTTAREIITAGYRTLAARCHPDAGGNHDAMIEVNRAAEWLRSEMERAG